MYCRYLHSLRVKCMLMFVVLLFISTLLWKSSPVVPGEVGRQDGDVADRNELRKLEVRRQCQRFPHLANRPIDRSQLSQLVVDDQHKIIWCGLPKVACTNWKRVFLILRGVNKSEVLSIPRKRVHYAYRMDTLAQYYGDHDAIKYRLDNYLKFVVVRDHWDRLLSCFRDKYENNSANDPAFRSNAGIGSVRHYSHGRQPTFQGFLDFIINDRKSLKRPPAYPENAHWVQFYKLCNPCAISFDVIGKYDSFAEDSNYILERANISNIVGRFPKKRAPHEERNKKGPSHDVIFEYYKHISNTVIDQIAHLYREDMDIFNLKRTP